MVVAVATPHVWWLFVGFPLKSGKFSSKFPCGKLELLFCSRKHAQSDQLANKTIIIKSISQRFIRVRLDGWQKERVGVVRSRKLVYEPTKQESNRATDRQLCKCRRRHNLAAAAAADYLYFRLNLIFSAFQLQLCRITRIKARETDLKIQLREPCNTLRTRLRQCIKVSQSPLLFEPETETIHSRHFLPQLQPNQQFQNVKNQLTETDI